MIPGGRSVACFHAEGLSGADWHARLMERSTLAEDQNRRDPIRADHGKAAPAGATSSRPNTTGESRDGPAARETIPDERPWIRFRDGVAGALLLAGSSMLALGHYSAGSLTLSAGLFGLARPLMTNNAVQWSMLAFTVAAALLSARALDRRALVQEAEEQWVALNEAVDDVASIRGRYPDSLRELGWRLPDITGETAARDPWGRPWLYEGSGDSQSRPVIQSLGSDGVPGSRDDVGGRIRDGQR